MLIDITLKITPQMVDAAQGNEKKAMTGHLGTHFDVMNQEFPLEFTERDAIVFDVSGISGRDIDIPDVDLERVTQDMFVAFYTGFIEQVGYGSREYFTDHPQLSHELIAALLEKKVSMIGIDFAGVRRGKEHTPKDQYCADQGVFIIENLCSLNRVLAVRDTFTALTFPMNFTDMTGLPCRVVAKL